MSACFDTAIHNLAKDILSEKLTIDQLSHTAECIGLAYGPKAEDVASLASSVALTWAWDKQQLH